MSCELADANSVEVAWALRGVADALAGRPAAEGAREAGPYRAPYMRLYNAMYGEI